MAGNIVLAARQSQLLRLPAGMDASNEKGVCRMSEGSDTCGRRYTVKVNPASSLKLTLEYTARAVGESAFALPATIQTGADSWVTLPVQTLVLVECLATRVTVSSSRFDYGMCIIPGASSMRPPYERILTLCNAQEQAIEWHLGEPSTNAQPGCTDVFRLEPPSGELPGHGTADVKVRACMREQLVNLL